jgi:hypothetical protein
MATTAQCNVVHEVPTSRNRFLFEAFSGLLRAINLIALLHASRWAC